MKNNRSIIECCNNTHQGAPRTGKQTCACASDLGDGSHVTCLLSSVYMGLFDCIECTLTKVSDCLQLCVCAALSVCTSRVSGLFTTLRLASLRHSSQLMSSSRSILASQSSTKMRSRLKSTDFLNRVLSSLAKALNSRCFHICMFYVLMVHAYNSHTV